MNQNSDALCREYDGKKEEETLRLLTSPDICCTFETGRMEQRPRRSARAPGVGRGRGWEAECDHTALASTSRCRSIVVPIKSR